MAEQTHTDVLAQGVQGWNQWRQDHPDEVPDLRGVEITDQDLSGIDLRSALLEAAILTNVNFTGADFQGADLTEVDFSDSDLDHADLSHAALRQACFARANLDGAFLNGCDARTCDFDEAAMVNIQMVGADLSGLNLAGRGLSGALLYNADLSGADLRGAICVEAVFSNSNLSGARLGGADLTRAELVAANLANAVLRGADLSHASIVGANIDGADLTQARVHAILATHLSGEPKAQHDLILTAREDAEITTDGLEIGQFLSLVHGSRAIQDAFDPAPGRAVLILGRFSSPDRRATINYLRDKLRASQMIPISLDLDGPTPADYMWAVRSLGRMSLFAIMDLTNPVPVSLDLAATVKKLKIPYQPIVDSRENQNSRAEIAGLQSTCHWVLPTIEYDSDESLNEQLTSAVVHRALAKLNELRADGAGDRRSLAFDDLPGAANQ